MGPSFVQGAAAMAAKLGVLKTNKQKKELIDTENGVGVAGVKMSNMGEGGHKPQTSSYEINALTTKCIPW